MKKIIVMVLTCILLISGISTNAINAEENYNLNLDFIDELTNNSIDEGLFPGATVLIKLGDEILYESSFGDALAYDMGHKLDSPIKMTNETLYDLASITKVAATTQAIMMLYDQGKLNLEDKVEKYIPGFGVNGKENITIIDLLTHTSGLPQWEPTFLYASTRNESLEYFKNLEMLYETGTAMKYSDFSFIGLAFIVESVTGEPIEEYLENNLYSKLDMKSTMYVPLKHGIDKNMIAATSWGNPFELRMSDEQNYPGYGYDTSAHAEAFKKFNGWREYTLHGEVNDGNAGMANEGVAGHAGLFSTARDLSKLGDLMLNGGEVNGEKIYSQETIDLFTSADSSRFNRGLGWQVGGASEKYGYVGKYAEENVFSHAGFTGTQFILDKTYNLQVIILTNKQNIGHDNGNYKSPYLYSRTIMNEIYEQLFETEEYLINEIIEMKKWFENQDRNQYPLEDYDQAQNKIEDFFTKVDDITFLELVDVYNELKDTKNELTKLYMLDLEMTIRHFERLNHEEYDADSILEIKNMIKDLPKTYKTHEEFDSIVSELSSKIFKLKKISENNQEVKEDNVKEPEKVENKSDAKLEEKPVDKSEIKEISKNETLPNTGMSFPLFASIGVLSSLVGIFVKLYNKE